MRCQWTFNALIMIFNALSMRFQRYVNVCQRFSTHWKMFFNAFIMICNTLATFCSREIKTFDIITQRNREDFPSNSCTDFIHPANISLVLLNEVKRSVNLIIVFTQNLEEIRQSNTLFPQGGSTSEIWLTANTELKKRNKQNRNIPCIIFLATFLLFPVECTSQTRRRHHGDRDSILSCT